MTWKETLNRDNKATRKPKTRQTPKDVENEKNGIFPPEKPEKTYRSTTEENRASKLAPEIVSSHIMNISGWIGMIERELAEMNLGKQGRPYEYCNTMFMWILMLLGDTCGTFSSVTGMARGILESHGIKAPSISTVHRRLIELAKTKVKEAPPEDPRIICMYATPTLRKRPRNTAADSSGMNLVEFFQYCGEKWDTKSTSVWLKLHSLVDIDTGEILAYVLTYNDVGDPNMLPFLLEIASNAGHRLSKVYADGAYGTVENWKCVIKVHKTQFITSFRRDSNAKSHGCMEMGRAKRLWRSLPYDEWVKETGYGVRWRVEGSFSDFKRQESEVFRSRSEDGHKLQSFAKVSVYNFRKEIRSDILGISRRGIDITSTS